MHKLLAGSCLVPCMTVALPFAAQAQTTVSSTRTTAVVTSASGDLTITSAGSIEPASGVAVTVDSNNSVSNAGDILFSDVDDTTGIQITSGVTATITNSGTITLDESLEAADDDDDDDDDGPFAEGSRRYGIRALGDITGTIDNSGTITVEGNGSAGIHLGGTLTGSLTSSGTISVLGNDIFGVRTGDVIGDVTLEGTITVVGENAIGYAAQGDVAGTVTIQGTITSTGYRYTSSPVITSTLDADDLLQGGAAVSITGDVGGGIVLAAPPSDEDDAVDDEDGDGVDDADEGTAAISSYGAAPALLVGSTGDIAIGAVAGDDTGNGLIIQGTAYGYGIYEGVDATAVRIGGEGGTVIIAGGIGVSGSVAAYGLTNATALMIADGALVPSLTNSGTITATGGSESGELSRGLLITAGGSLATISNSGAIDASNTGLGISYAIQDLSGTLTSIDNIGSITATATAGTAIAIDVSANTGGVTITQSLSTVEDATAPSIIGDILFGSGSDNLAASSGRVTGNVSFGAGTNSLALSGTAVLTGDIGFGTGDDSITLGDSAGIVGNVDFGGGSDVMTLSGTASFTGSLSNSEGLSLNVAGGSFMATNSAAIALSSLSVGSTGTIGVSIDGSGTSTLFTVSGAASFETGSRLSVSLSSVLASEGSFTVVSAASLTGTPEADLPYLFDGSAAAGSNGALTLTIERKTATELGLNRWEGAAYDSILSVADSDADIASVLLDKTDAASLKSVFRQMLPDNAGGTFDMVTAGSRAAMRFLDDRGTAAQEPDGLHLLLQQVGWGASKGVGQTSAYDILGWGMIGGAELRTGLGSFGGTLAYLTGRNSDGSNDNEVVSNQYEASLFWQMRSGGLQAHARASAAKIDFESRRFFNDNYDATTVARTASATWGGTLLSGSAGASYTLQAGRFSIRPIGSIEYYRLNEDARTETGGGSAFDLSVARRKSDELAGITTLAVGYDLKSHAENGGYFRVEAEGGMRTILGGSIASTVASFESGSSFTLDPDARTDGWLGRLRVTAGDDSIGFIGEASAEKQQGDVAISLRAVLRTAF